MRPSGQTMKAQVYMSTMGRSYNMRLSADRSFQTTTQANRKDRSVHWGYTSLLATRLNHNLAAINETKLRLQQRTPGRWKKGTRPQKTSVKKTSHNSRSWPSLSAIEVAIPIILIRKTCSPSVPWKYETNRYNFWSVTDQVLWLDKMSLAAVQLVQLSCLKNGHVCFLISNRPFRQVTHLGGGISDF